MEATEPTPIKVGTLPALRTSGWNDRDYAGIGTNNSVIGPFNGTSHYLSVADSSDWAYGSGEFWIDFWVYDTGISTAHGYIGQWTSGQKGWGLWYNDASSGTLAFAYSTNGTDQTTITIGATSILKDDKWEHFSFGKSGTNFVFYLNGKQQHSASLSATFHDSTYRLEVGALTGAAGYFAGFMDDVKIYKGSGYTANTAIQAYMNGRAGVYATANSSMVLHIKADSTYGDTSFTDASPSAHTITNNNGLQHHIEDDRTANTALYFDRFSKIEIPFTQGGSIDFAGENAQFTLECWAKQKGRLGADGNRGGTLFSWGEDGQNNFHFSVHSSTDALWNYSVIGNTSQLGNWYSADGTFKFGVWNHCALVWDGPNDKARMFVNGVCVTELSDSEISVDQMSYMDSNDFLTIGYRSGPTNEFNYEFHGWMDGIRITSGMHRYTSGIPTDGQSPAKDYDDGRSSNVSSNTWATSSTRRFYGINTHTYLQTTEYSTDANTVLLIRGDDAQTANDGVNMYGENGFHLEFKEVGAGDERDYNNFNTGKAGLGSDTSATQEFEDDATVFLLRSRPTQANGNVQFINEVDQSTLSTGGGSIHHTEAQNIFSVDANTANVSVSSGGSGTY